MRAVTRRDPQQDQETGAARADDDPVDPDLRPGDPLDNCPHGEILSLLLPACLGRGVGPGGVPHRCEDRVNEITHLRERACRYALGMEAARNPWPALGTLLVRDGAVTPEQLELALAEKRLKPELRLGEILVENGFVTRVAVSRVLAEQHELEFVELDFAAIEIEAAMLLPENLARRYRALPIRFLEDGYVLVAVADPTNVMFSDELRLALGMPVQVCVASPDAIELVITKVNDDASVSIEEVVTDAQESEDDATVLDLEHNTPAVVFINRAISKALDLGASDIHFTPQQRRLFVRVRVDGVMRELTSIAGSQGAAVSSRLKIMGGLDIAERRAPQDGRVSIKRGNDRSTCESRSCRRRTARRSRSASSPRERHPIRSTRSACGHGAAPPSSARSRSRSAPSSSSAPRAPARRRPSTPACRCSTRPIGS